jgi:hypothetical protein
MAASSTASPSSATRWSRFPTTRRCAAGRCPMASPTAYGACPSAAATAVRSMRWLSAVRSRVVGRPHRRPGLRPVLLRPALRPDARDRRRLRPADFRACLRRGRHAPRHRDAAAGRDRGHRRQEPQDRGTGPQLRRHGQLADLLVDRQARQQLRRREDPLLRPQSRPAFRDPADGRRRHAVGPGLLAGRRAAGRRQRRCRTGRALCRGRAAARLCDVRSGGGLGIAIGRQLERGRHRAGRGRPVQKRRGTLPRPVLADARRQDRDDRQGRFAGHDHRYRLPIRRYGRLRHRPGLVRHSRHGWQVAPVPRGAALRLPRYWPQRVPRLAER